MMYLIMGNTGEYSDHRGWCVRVYDSKEAADKACKAMNDLLREYGVHHESANRSVSYELTDELLFAESEKGKLFRKLLNDDGFGCDYTGTDYYVVEVPKG